MKLKLMFVALLTAALTACGGYGGGKSASSSSGSGSSELEMNDFYFKPKTLSGTAGQKLTVTLKNDGKVQHNFSIPGRGVDQTVQPGQSATVTVTVPQSGSVQFFCKFHKSQGMTGSLTISSSGGTGGTTTGTSTGY